MVVEIQSKALRIDKASHPVHPGRVKGHEDSTKKDAGVHQLLRFRKVIEACDDRGK